MSRIYRITRARWAAREMVLTRWVKQPQERAAPGETICELMVDGRRMNIVNPGDEGDIWGIWWHVIEAGQEVSPWGELFEFSDHGFLPAEPLPDREGFLLGGLTSEDENGIRAYF